MFKELEEKNYSLIFTIFMFIYMGVHLYFMNSYMYTLVDTAHDFLGSSDSYREIYKNLFTVGHWSYALLGVVFWISPKLILPIFLILYFFIQAPLMNGLNWHDQHVAYLTMLLFTITYFKKGLKVRKWVILFLSMFFFGAGVGKIHVGGWEWMDGHTAQYRFLQYYVLYDAKLGIWIANNFLFCKIISILTVLFEVIFPICLFVPRLEKFMVWLSLLFLTTIYVTMKINFFLFLVPVYIVFLPWDKILSKSGLRISPAQHANIGGHQ